jgi:hypothetical protein
MPPVGFFFVCPGFFPFEPRTVFKSFSSFMSLYVPCYRPYTINTTQTYMPLVGFFFPVPFFPLIHFVLFKSFCPSCHLCSILLSLYNKHNTNIHAPGGIFFWSGVFSL